MQGGKESGRYSDTSEPLRTVWKIPKARMPAPGLVYSTSYVLIEAGDVSTLTVKTEVHGI
jgi:hypothetical protein